MGGGGGEERLQADYIGGFLGRGGKKGCRQITLEDSLGGGGGRKAAADYIGGFLGRGGGGKKGCRQITLEDSLGGGGRKAAGRLHWRIPWEGGKKGCRQITSEDSLGGGGEERLQADYIGGFLGRGGGGRKAVKNCSSNEEKKIKIED